jgi:hypothetical protein
MTALDSGRPPHCKLILFSFVLSSYCFMQMLLRLLILLIDERMPRAPDATPDVSSNGLGGKRQKKVVRSTVRLPFSSACWYC